MPGRTYGHPREGSRLLLFAAMVLVTSSGLRSRLSNLHGFVLPPPAPWAGRDGLQTSQQFSFAASARIPRRHRILSSMQRQCKTRPSGSPPAIAELEREKEQPELLDPDRQKRPRRRSADLIQGNKEQEEILDPVAAVLVLGLVTILWGAQHTAIKVALEGTDSLTAGVLNALRFSLAAVCFALWLPPLPDRWWTSKAAFGKSKEPAELQHQQALYLEWKGGAELGFWLFAGFFLQSLGLLFTTAQRSALLLYLNVKLVPFFALVIMGTEVATSTWAIALVAFTGTLLVAGDGAAGVPPNIGDALSFVAACASAMFILRLETYAPSTDAKALNAVTMLFVALLSCIWSLGTASLEPSGLAGVGPCLWERVQDLVKNHGFLLIYLGVVTTAFTNWLQTLGQRSVPATVASAIYALDPLWGCVFAYFFLGEVLGPQGLLGALVLLGVWCYQLGAVSSWQADSESTAG